MRELRIRTKDNELKAEVSEGLKFIAGFENELEYVNSDSKVTLYKLKEDSKLSLMGLTIYLWTTDKFILDN